MIAIRPSPRLRASPYYEATVAEGLTTASIYNRMLMPTSYGDPEAEYWRLIEGVSQWDVACERQVQLRGPDAGVLAQILCPRDISKFRDGQGKYVPLCNHEGVLINDPIVLRRADDLWWLSIADSDIWFWARAIAAERRLAVEVSEPDVSPMAIQGPKAEDVVAAVCGEWVRQVRYFWFNETHIEGIPVVVQRSGWSKQGGFEIYLMDGARGTELWNIFREAGGPFGIGPGSPATAERTESGLVSVGGDTDGATSPFEVRLEKYVNLDAPDDVIGMRALRQISVEGAARRQLGIVLEGKEPAPSEFNWEPIYHGDTFIGDMTHCVWSPRMKANIGYALVGASVPPGTAVTVLRDNDRRTDGELRELPFL